ncbi:MAG: virulence protein SciE type, partial [Planctomycetes bacterium]|nr:virulence protein SciE type [Planctomycetota bacterium]
TTESVEFEWIADADPHLGPVLEMIVNGKYYWVPFARVRRLEFEPPSDLRDMVWTPVFVTWANGGESPGFIPTRYPATIAHGDDAAKLARTTRWLEEPSGSVGVGQRLFATDVDEYSILDLRTVTIGAAEVEAGDE